MTHESPKPMGLGTIFALIILTGTVVGAVLGVLRAELGGSALLTGGVAGGVTGGVASVLFRRRARAGGERR